MEDGSVFSWGYGKMGPLGHNNNESTIVPQKIEGLSNIVRVDCGNNYTIVLDSCGKLYSFGDNTYGQLGLNVDTLKETSPKRIFTSASQG